MTAEELIRTLDLAPHPEGGWYRETYRSTAEPGERAAATAVYYVIQPGERSLWNRVDADEMWLWHAGDALELMIAEAESGPARAVRLGGRIGEGEQPQGRHSQGAVAVGGSRRGRPSGLHISFVHRRAGIRFRGI